MNQSKIIKAYQRDLATKYKNFKAYPIKSLDGAHAGISSLWETDKKWAITELYKNMPEELAVSVFNQYVKRWGKYVLKKGQSKSANIWLRNRIDMVRRAVALFPVPIFDLKHEGLRKKMSQIWCDKCLKALKDAADNKKSIYEAELIVQEFANQWGFVPKSNSQEIAPLKNESKKDYQIRVKNELAWFRLTRLLDDYWWERKIELAYRQFCEYCQIINGRVRKGVSLYLSETGLREFRIRKIASTLALSKMIARNEETGQEIEMLDLVKRSIANPAIRRNELMVRMRGFEDVAQEKGLVSGLFTITAPSKYHPYKLNNKKDKSFENDKYEGFSPKQTQKYLSKVWSKARAKLNRMNIKLIGFRVCEPHHDGTPHWHALFFFKPADEKFIRYVLADYFTQTDRDQLNVTNAEFNLWKDSFSEEDEQSSEQIVDAVKTAELIDGITERIKARFDYKMIDPKKGSATGYIAKYISKNIDGYKILNDGETGTAADKAAEAVCGWSSLWRIRQFQQIGGPSVSVWRELRRLEQDKNVKEAKTEAKEKGEKYKPKVRSFIDLQKAHDSIEVARIAADSGNWGMYIHAMGGIFCTRKEQPIRMVYKLVSNCFGEQVKKLKGIGSYNKTMITHTDVWTICKANAESDFDFKENDSFSTWSSVNNCTENVNHAVKHSIVTPFEPLEIELEPILLNQMMNGADFVTDDDYKVLSMSSSLDMQLCVEGVFGFSSSP